MFKLVTINTVKSWLNDGGKIRKQGWIQFSFLNLFTRALPFFDALLSIYWLLAKFISNAHMLHKPSSRLQILLLWSHTLSDTHSDAGISERVSISFQRLPPWVYRALTLHSRATPSIVSQIIVHRSWFSGKITFLRQTLRQHVPRLNWKQSSKGMKRSDPFTGMLQEANKILEVCRAPKD